MPDELDSLLATVPTVPRPSGRLRAPRSAALARPAPVLNANLSAHANDIISTLGQQGYDVRLGDTLRTPQQQAQKVRRGVSRTYNSKHLTGSALDLVVYRDGKPDWDTTNPAWQAIGTEAKSRGLRWGGDFKHLYDPGHVELGGNAPAGDDLDKLLQGVPHADELDKLLADVPKVDDPNDTSAPGWGNTWRYQPRGYAVVRTGADDLHWIDEQGQVMRRAFTGEGLPKSVISGWSLGDDNKTRAQNQALLENFKLTGGMEPEQIEATLDRATGQPLVRDDKRRAVKPDDATVTPTVFKPGDPLADSGAGVRSAVDVAQWANNAPALPHGFDTGQPLKVRVPAGLNDAQTYAALSDAALAQLGPDALRAGKAYREQTGHNLAQPSVSFAELVQQGQAVPVHDERGHVVGFDVTVTPKRHLVDVANAINSEGIEGAHRVAGELTQQAHDYNRQYDEREQPGVVKQVIGDSVVSGAQLAHNVTGLVQGSILRGPGTNLPSEDFDKWAAQNDREQQMLNDAQASLPHSQSNTQQAIRTVGDLALKLPLYTLAGEGFPLVMMAEAAHEGPQKMFVEGVKGAAAAGAGRAAKGLLVGTEDAAGALSAHPVLANLAARGAAGGVMAAQGATTAEGRTMRGALTNFGTGAIMPVGGRERALPDELSNRAPLGLHGATAEPVSPRIVSSEVLRPAGSPAPAHDVVVVERPDGTRQAFYRSSGRNSNRPGVWLPFDGIARGGDYHGWFNKHRFTAGELSDPAHSLHRYGTPENQAVSAWLGQQDIQPGRAVGFGELNDSLKAAGVYHPSTDAYSNFTPPRAGALAPPENSFFTGQEPARPVQRMAADAPLPRAVDLRSPDGETFTLNTKTGMLTRHADGQQTHIDELRAATQTDTAQPHHANYQPRAGDGTFVEGAPQVPAAGDALDAVLRTVPPAVPARSVRSVGSHLLSGTLDVMNAPRSLMTTADLSAAGRQGFMLSLTEPRIAARAMGRQVKSLVSQGSHDELMRWLVTHPDADLAEHAGLYSAMKQQAGLSGREEAFMSRLAGRLPVVKQSERAYVAYLDSLRQDTFSKYARELERAGVSFDSHPEEFKSIARFINSATGRGELPQALEKLTPALNATLFAPRNLKGRFDVLNPVFYARMSPVARKIAIRKAVQFAGTVAGGMYLAHLAGAKVTLNPDDPDFGKVVVGRTHYDFTGGMRGPVRLIARLGKTFATTTGNPIPAAAGVLAQFARQNTSPVVNYVIAAKTGKEVNGQPFEWGGHLHRNGRLDPGGGALARVLPLSAQDLFEAWAEDGGMGVLKAAPAAIMGIGVQTYEPKAQRGGRVQGETY